VYFSEIIAHFPYTVNERAAKRKPPKGGYHAQKKRKDEEDRL